MDDIYISEDDLSTMESLKSLLDKKFSIKDFGPAKYYLRIELHTDFIGIFLSQQKFITDLLQSANLVDCKPLSVPLDPHQVV